MRLRTLWLSLALAACLPAASLLPDQVAGGAKTGSKPAVTSDKALWDEYGLDASESAEYKAPGKAFTVTAYRFKDPTGAFAAFEWQRPGDARPSKLAEAAAETHTGVLALCKNYVVEFSGLKPQAADVQALTAKLPGQRGGPGPSLPSYLPASGVVANSQRYVSGPVGLEKFGAGVPAEVAGFDSGAEVAIARYNTPGGGALVAVFSYPTPQIARVRLPGFEKLSGAAVKRSGPIVAVVLPPADPKSAERLLSQINYEGKITLSERVPTAKDNVAELILNIFMLIGIILAIFLTAGIMFGVVRRWSGWGNQGDPMTLLHLSDKR